MKRTIYFLIAAIGILIPVTAEAEGYNQSIDMTESEYNNLLNLGFTEEEVYFMGEEEYLNNKDLVGEVVGQTVEYYASTTNDFTGESSNYKVSKDEFEAGRPLIMLRGGPYVETGYKKMTTTITAVGTRFMYKVTLEWKNMPAVRSIDVLGIGIHSNNVYIYSSIFFQQNFCLSSGGCSTSTAHGPKISATGGAAYFYLPTVSIKSLSSYLYFYVDKNTTAKLTRIYAYGDYAHATKTVSANNLSYSIMPSGIILASSIIGSYDTMDFALASYACNW